MNDPIEMIALLAQRASIVEQIANGGESKRALTQTLPLSRSTITRAIQDLTTAQMVQKVGNNYELTLHGQIAHREFRHLVDRYSGLTAAMPLLDHLPETTVIPGIVFDDATVIQPSPPIPDAPRTRFVNRIRQSEKVIGTVKVVNQQMVKLFHNQFTTRDPQLSLLLDKQVVEHLQHAHADILRTVLETDHSTFWSSKQMPPFSLTLIDQSELWLGIYNEHGQLQGFLHTESPSAVEWAEQRLQHLIGQATPICRQDVIAEDPKKR